MRSSEWSRRKPEIEAKLKRYERALKEISQGDGCYGAQGFKFKNIAREALGLRKVGC